MNIMRRFVSGLFLALSLMTMMSGAVHAQLKNDGGINPFTKYYQNTFGNVYDIDTDKRLEDTLPTAIGKVIGIALSFIGVILLVIMVYAGFLWLTAGGNDDQVGDAKNLIRNGVIGMAIALSAFVLTNFIVNQLNSALESDGVSSGGGGSGLDAGTGPAAGTGTR